jgi:hypothetical protein
MEFQMKRFVEFFLIAWRVRFVFALLVTLAPLASGAEPAASNPLLGLWEVVSVTNLATGTMQPTVREFHMYTASYEMIILAKADRPKIKKSLSNMTAEEVMSQQPIGAGFYQYRIEGDTLVRTAAIALSSYYEGRTVHTEFEVTGDMLTIRDNHSADGQRREWKMRRVE